MISPLNDIKSFSDHLNATSKHDPCEICGDITGRDRQKHNQENFTLCAGTPTAKKGDRVGPYICVNDNAKGHTTHIWILDKGFSQWEDDRKTQYLLEKQRRALVAEQERQTKIQA